MIDPEKQKRVCANCRYFHRYTVRAGPERGECRKNPPVHTARFDGWPPVTVADWCGEFSLNQPGMMEAS